MNSIETLSEFFGWSCIINIGLLTIAALAVMFNRDSIMAIHSRLLGVSAEELPRAYFQYLAQYKIAIIIFNLVPYIALKIMT